METGEGQQAVDGVSRRSLLRGGLLAGAGLATLGAASAVGTGTAKAAAAGSQSDWGYCIYCATMWWTPGKKNPCEGNSPNGQHGTGVGDYNYTLLCNVPGDTSGTNPQSGWTWCSDCDGLFWGQKNSVCAGNPNETASPWFWNPHAVGSSTSYDINFGYSTIESFQADWRWCTQCHLMFWPGVNDVNGGACPALLNNYYNDYNYYYEHRGGGTNYDNYWYSTW
jgi:hypothetical protein